MSSATKDDENSTTAEKAVCNNEHTTDENVNDDDTTHGSSLKKKIGKFRCLSNEQSPNDADCLENNVNNQEQQIKTSEPFIPPTLLANTPSTKEADQSPASSQQQTESSPQAQNSNNNEEENEKPTTTKKGKAARKKGLKSKKVVDENDDSQSSFSRRRSTRLKSLEEKQKEVSNSETNQTEENANSKANDEDETRASTKENDEEVNKKDDESSSPSKKKDKKKKEKKKSKCSKHDKRKTRRKSSASKQENSDSDSSDPNRPNSNDCFTPPSSSSAQQNSSGNVLSDCNSKPEKVKSRWRRNSELESGHQNENKKDALSPSDNLIHNNNDNLNSKNSSYSSTTNTQSTALSIGDNNIFQLQQQDENTEPMPNFQTIEYNNYLVEKKKTKFTKEVKKMVCDCILTKEERSKGIMGCGEDCLNRMLMIECGSRCPLGDHCANKRFLKKQYSKVEAFKTSRKGWGLRAVQPLQPGQFIMEYVGEVIGPSDFRSRVKKYSKEGHEHHFFMALKADEIIDATTKGNITRFVNHSCDPNAETQKWTVNGDLRIGFFSTKYIQPGEEVTFDYQFQRYGKEAQRCYCEAENCRGFIGATDVSNEVDIEIEDESKSLMKSKSDKEPVDKLKEEFKDLGLEEEIDKLKSYGGLRNRQQTLMLARLMVRAEDTQNRLKLLEVIRMTQEQACLRLLLDYHGLQLLWSWMVDLEDLDLKSEIIKVLEFLPILNKTMLKDSKVYDVIEKWAVDVKTNQEPPIERENDKKLTNGDVNMEVDKSTAVAEVKQEDVKEEETLLTDGKTTAAEDSIAAAASSNELKSSLHKGFNIIKKDSKSSQNQQQPQQQKTLPNISMQATRLLNLWKDLKEVYRIPRLERQKRHEDEKEADRKAMENEENVSRNTPAFLRKNLKRPFEQINKFGSNFKPQQQNTFYTQYSQNPQHNHQNQSSSLTTITTTSNECNSVNKMSKEEHRAYYNVELMRKDYEEAMRTYKKQVEQYNETIKHQLNNLNSSIVLHSLQPPMMPPAPPNIYQTYHQLSQSSTPSPLSTFNQFNNQSNNLFADKPALQQPITTNEFKNITPVYASNLVNEQQPLHSYTQYSQENDYSSTAATPLNQTSYAQPPKQQEQLVSYNHLTNYQQSTEEHIEIDESQQEVELEKSWNTLYAELTAGLNGKARKTNYIECTNDQHKLNENNSLKPDHCLKLPEDEEIDDCDSQFDDLFLTPGTYFVCEDKTYFIPCKSSGFSQQVIECKNDMPSKERSKKELPKDWNYSKDANGYYYYYNKITNQVQWNVPSSEKSTDTSNSNKENLKDSSSVDNTDSSITPRIDPNNIDLSSIDQATLSEIMKQFNGNDLANLNNLDLLDPRKRTKLSSATSSEIDSQELLPLSTTACNSLSLELENKIIKFPYQQQQQQQLQRFQSTKLPENALIHSLEEKKFAALMMKS